MGKDGMGQGGVRFAWHDGAATSLLLLLLLRLRLRAHTTHAHAASAAPPPRPTRVLRRGFVIGEAQKGRSPVFCPNGVASQPTLFLSGRREKT